jgi:uncharacterized spore protein YtfJ
LNNKESHGGMPHHMKKGFGTKKVFGEPMKINDDVTIIPVAKMKMGGGGGSGEQEPAATAEGEEQEAKEQKGSGRGYGYMGAVMPVGYIEIKGKCVKFHHIPDYARIAKCAAGIAFVCMVICKKKMHMKKMAHMGMGGMPPWMMHGQMHGRPCECGMHGGKPTMPGMHHDKHHMMMHHMMMRQKMHGTGKPPWMMHKMGKPHHMKSCDCEAC